MKRKYSPIMSSRKKVSQIIIFCVLIIIQVSCTQNNFDPSKFRVLSTQSYYIEAEALAKQWKIDAYVESIYASFALHNDNTPLSISYSFRSKTEPSKWFSVTFFETQSEIKTETSSGDYLEGNNRPLTLEINFENINVDSLDALILAFESGGKEFINRNHGVDDYSFIKLEQKSPALGQGPLEWVVSFSANTYKVVSITIDPVTGDILDTYSNE